MGKRPLNSPSTRAVFLDRDGVLNANVFYGDTQAWESPRTVGDFALNEGVIEALAALKAAGFALIVVSNQPNLAKRKATRNALDAIHAKMEACLAAAGLSLDAVHYCFHHPEGLEPAFSKQCACRKPSPYFLEQSQKTMGLDLPRSWMIGDRDSDIACGASAGARTIFVESQGCKPPGAYAMQPDHRAISLRAAAQIILAH